MKIYISGPMTAMPNLNFGEFEDAEQIIIARGHEAVNPHKFVEDKSTPYIECLRIDMQHLAQCDAICLLPGWVNSAGARKEFNWALDLEMKIFFSVESIPLGLE